MEYHGTKLISLKFSFQEKEEHFCLGGALPEGVLMYGTPTLMPPLEQFKHI